ncbi:MAG: hypothetical protein ACXABG_13910, partial [Promethearchaeota archaeon]
LDHQTLSPKLDRFMGGQVTGVTMDSNGKAGYVGAGIIILFLLAIAYEIEWLIGSLAVLILILFIIAVLGAAFK